MSALPTLPLSHADVEATLSWWVRTMPKTYARYLSDGPPTEHAAKAALEEAITRTDRRVQRLAEQLRSHDISLDEWQQQMAVELVRLRLAACALARGGVGRLTLEDLQGDGLPPGEDG